MQPQEEEQQQSLALEPTSGSGSKRRRSQRSNSLQSIPEDALKDFADDDLNLQYRIGSSPTNIIPWQVHRQTIGTTSTSNRSKLESALATDMTALVDFERSKYKEHLIHLPPFQVSPYLEQLAYQQASAMASVTTVFHSVTTIDELKVFLSSATVAENVQRGDALHDMHQETMHHSNAVNRSNVLSPYFDEFGCGVCVGRDGKIYSCQLFRSNPVGSSNCNSSGTTTEKAKQKQQSSYQQTIG